MKFSSLFKILSSRRASRGFTLLEVLVVIAIIGILLGLSYPAIVNTTRTRSLENAARTIATDLQWAKLQAVKTKMNHRLRFDLKSGVWFMTLERETQSTVWNPMPGYMTRSISSDLNVTVTLPNDGVTNSVIYNSLGLVENFNGALNNVILQSDRLKNQGQADVRMILIFAGGTVQYVRTAS